MTVAEHAVYSRPRPLKEHMHGLSRMLTVSTDAVAKGVLSHREAFQIFGQIAIIEQVHAKQLNNAQRDALVYARQQTSIGVTASRPAARISALKSAADRLDSTAPAWSEIQRLSINELRLDIRRFSRASRPIAVDEDRLDSAIDNARAISKMSAMGESDINAFEYIAGKLERVRGHREDYQMLVADGAAAADPVDLKLANMEFKEELRYAKNLLDTLEK